MRRRPPGAAAASLSGRRGEIERREMDLIRDYTRTLKRGLTGGEYSIMSIREIVLYSLWCSIDCGFDYFPDMRNQWGVNLDVRHMWVGKHS